MTQSVPSGIIWEVCSEEGRRSGLRQPEKGQNLPFTLSL